MAFICSAFSAKQMFNILFIMYLESQPNWKVPYLKNEIVQCQCLLRLIAIVKKPYFKFLSKSLLSFSAAFKFIGLASQHLTTATVFHLHISQFLAHILQFIIQLLRKKKALRVMFSKIKYYSRGIKRGKTASEQVIKI